MGTGHGIVRSTSWVGLFKTEFLEPWCMSVSVDHSDLDGSGKVVLLFFHAKSTLDIKLCSFDCKLCSVTAQLGKICSLFFYNFVLQTHTGTAGCNRHHPDQDFCPLVSEVYRMLRLNTIFGQRTFSHASPAVWNSLPASIQASTNTASFHRLLKTHFDDEIVMSTALFYFVSGY